MNESNEEETRDRGFAEALAPAGFAAGIILVLIGLVIAGESNSGWIVLAIGVVLALVFGFSWAYRATRGLRETPEPPPELAAPDVAEEPEDAVAPKRYSRGVFLTGATAGVSGLIGAAVTVPIVGFAVAPAFVGQGERDIDLGPIDNFPQGEFVITTFDYRDNEAPSVNRRTAYIRNNGFINEVPSFTVISNRCTHLGCPVQPAGPTGAPVELETASGPVRGLRHRGQPHRRASGSGARPLQLPHPQRQPRSLRAFQRVRGDGRRRECQDEGVQALPARDTRRRARRVDDTVGLMSGAA